MTKEDIDNKSRRLSIRIREMTIDDIADVFHLGEALFEPEKVPNMYRTWDEYEVIDLFYGDTEFCLVAEQDDQIVGFALGTTISKSRSAWKYGYLIWLGVTPEFQRMGIAERLFQRFKSLMLKEGVRILVVDTEIENKAAIHFFKRQGFTNPTEHMYLSLNLDYDRHRKKWRENGV